MTPPQIVPGPRQDIVVADAQSGEPRRMTVYTGTVWLAPEPQVNAIGGRIRTVSSPDVEPMDPTSPSHVFLPDSHPYRHGTDAVVSACGAPIGWVDQTGTNAILLYPLVARLDKDPRSDTRSWMAIEFRGQGRLHALNYTISVTVPLTAVG